MNLYVAIPVLQDLHLHEADLFAIVIHGRYIAYMADETNKDSCKEDWPNNNLTSRLQALKKIASDRLTTTGKSGIIRDWA